MADDEGGPIGECVLCACFLGFLVLLILPVILIPVTVDDMLVHRVENGTLYTLDLDLHNGTSTLSYNLSVFFSFLNPPEYDAQDLSIAKVTVELVYGSQQLGADITSLLPTFELQPSQTEMMPLDARGQQIIIGGGGDVARTTHAAAAALGYYTIEAKLHLRLFEHRWCDSSCMLYFLRPTSPLRGGGRYMFDGDAANCEIKCKKSGAIFK